MHGIVKAHPICDVACRNCSSMGVQNSPLFSLFRNKREVCFASQTDGEEGSRDGKIVISNNNGATSRSGSVGRHLAYR